MTTENPFEDHSDNKNYLEELVGEGKKFKTIEDLAKGKYNSDDMIEVLKAEKLQLEAELKTRMSLDEFYTKIKPSAPLQDDTGVRPPNDQDIPSQRSNPEDLEKVVLETLKKTEQERQIKQNEDLVIKKLDEVWGEHAGKELKKVAETLGVSTKYLQEVSRQSPAMFFKITGIDSPRSAPSGTSVPTSTVNFGNQNTNVRDAAFYRDLRKSNPKLYKETKTQIQMARDAHQMGESFFN